MMPHEAYNFMTFGSFRDEAEYLREAYKKNKAHKRVFWITRQGEKIRVKDLSDNHLLNIVRFLIRFAKSYQQNLSFPMFSGEIAQETAEQEYDIWTSTDPEEIATWLIGKRAIAIFLECEDRQIDYEEKTQ